MPLTPCTVGKLSKIFIGLNFAMFSSLGQFDILMGFQTICIHKNLKRIYKDCLLESKHWWGKKQMLGKENANLTITVK